MAEVFLAKSSGAEGIEKILVVKRVLPTFSRSPKFITMFIDEAKVAMRLNHPNIVQVYAFEQVKSEFLLAMEYVDGLDLGRFLSAARRKDRRLPYALSALIVMEVAKGLDYAHNRKDESGLPMDIVHRDVSPQNVLISYDGTVRIADFGIARARMVSEETGVIKGKFSYMSPEQARGQAVDRRSDVYSLGVLFAELLMNRPMYRGLQGTDVLEHVRDGRISSPRSVDEEVPALLDDIARRAMSFDPAERYASGRSFAGALSRWLHEQDELYDAGELERFLLEVAPREVTSPENPRHASDTPGLTHATQGALGQGGRDIRERRNVVAVFGRLRDARETESASAPQTGEAASNALARVLDDIAFKYDAILDWPEGLDRRSFRFVLGLGRVSVDDPLHATRLALDVIEALDGISADSTLPLTAAIGLSRGMVSTLRSGGRVRHEPIDNVFHVARGLAEAGHRAEVLATGEIYRLARRAFAFEAQTTRDIAIAGEDGSSGARLIRAYRLRGARTREDRLTEARTLASQVGLFGRASEIQALALTYEETVRKGKSSYLVVSGELGVGKSALVAAALGRFQPDPQLLRVECVFGTSEIPYAAVSELVREACGISEDTSPEHGLEALRRTVSRLVEAADRRRAVIDALAPLVAPSERKPETDPSDRAHHMTHAVRELLGGLAKQRPTVVWVDGVQFGDAPSLELVSRLLAHTQDVPLLAIFCTRPSDRTGPVFRGIPRLELGELAEDDRRALISTKLGEALVPPELHQAIVHRAGGNPFFVLELVDALLERGVIHVEGEGRDRHVVRRPGATLALPTTLEDVIAARIAELPHRERAALRWLSVSGPGLRASDLAKIAGQSLDDALASLEGRGILHRRAGGALSFSSAVIRHVAYESTDHSDRTRMHRRIGAWLSNLGARIAPARIARHHELAGEEGAAALAWKEAGKAALQVHSNRDALRFFARALELLPDESPTRFDIHEMREGILRLQGRRSEQRIELEAMRELAERARDPRLLAIALARLARHDLDASRPAGVEGMLRRALDAAIEAGDKSAEVEVLRLFGHLRRDQGDVPGALDAFDRALARAGLESSQLAARGLTLVQKAILERRVGQLEAALEASAEAVIIFRRLGHNEHEAQALNSLGLSLHSSGSYEDAIAVLRASVILDREAGHRLTLGRKASNIGQIYAELGDTHRALEYLDRALDIFESLDDLVGRIDALTAKAELLAEQLGDIPGSVHTLELAHTIAERLGSPYSLAYEGVVRASLHTDRGNYEEGERVSSATLGHARSAATKGYELLAGALRARCLANLGRIDEARQLAEQVQAGARSKGMVTRAERVHYNLSLAFDATGEHERAKDAMRTARAIIDAHLALIQDETLRSRYLETPIVRAIRDDRASS